MALWKKPRDMTLGNAYTDQKNNEQAGDPEQELRQKGYSWAYHRFFEGYAERKVVGPDGKTRIERFFVGDTHKHRMTDSRWVGLKLLYLILYLLCAASFILITARKAPGNFLWYVQVGEAIGALSLLALLYMLIQYLSSPRVLDLHTYKQLTVFFKTLALVTAIATLLPPVGVLVHLILDGAAEEISLFLLMLIPPLLAFAMWFLEARIVKYDKEIGKDAPYDAIHL